jgi:hypothetical protein
MKWSGKHDKMSSLHLSVARLHENVYSNVRYITSGELR